MRPATRRARLLGAGIALPGVLLPLLAFLLGWASAPSGWQAATGWARIPPDLRPGPSGEAAVPGMPEIVWLGHSGFLLRWPDVAVLLDPNTRSHCLVARRLLAPAPDLGELGPIDAALVSHPHFDHLDVPTLRSVDRLPLVVVPPGAEAQLRPLEGRGTRVVALAPDSDLQVGSLRVTAVPARHGAHRFHPLALGASAVGYVIERQGLRIFFAGDTGYGSHLAEIGRRFAPRIAILPIGAYSPAFPLQRYHLSPEQAARAAVDLGAELVVPCHFATFRLSLDPPRAALPRFARAAAALGVRWVMPGLAERGA